jgi:hypothetical protein
MRIADFGQKNIEINTYGHGTRTRLRAGTLPCTKRSRLPKNFFGEQVGEVRHFGVQARSRFFNDEGRGQW